MNCHDGSINLARVSDGAGRRCISMQRLWGGMSSYATMLLLSYVADMQAPLLTSVAPNRFLRKERPSNLVFSAHVMVTLRDRYTDWLPAGNRWHIDCFRCNTCGTILDSDANLLLLGDGSLICNNCTYSCSVCGNKIEDLAILTGDQAFCANCFKCRNCKKKIENLKYARTSQGIFCMECHESLMQRRRKKGQKNGVNRHKHLQPALHKSLPSLPPNAANQSVLSPEDESPPSDTYSETPTELPSHMHKPPSYSRTRSETGVTGEGNRAPPRRPANPRSLSSKSDHRDRSPLANDEERKGLTPCMNISLYLNLTKYRKPGAPLFHLSEQKGLITVSKVRSFKR